MLTNVQFHVVILGSGFRIQTKVDCPSSNLFSFSFSFLLFPFTPKPPGGSIEYTDNVAQIPQTDFQNDNASDKSPITVELCYPPSDNDSFNSEETVLYNESDTDTPTQDESEDHMMDFFNNPENWIILSQID